MTKSSLHENISLTGGVKSGSNRFFVIVFAVVVAIISLSPILSEDNRRVWLLIVAVIFLVIALIIPKALAPLNSAWFQLDQLLDEFVKPIIKGLIFF
jgi:hypothetical protein